MRLRYWVSTLLVVIVVCAQASASTPGYLSDLSDSKDLRVLSTYQRIFDQMSDDDLIHQFNNDPFARSVFFNLLEKLNPKAKRLTLKLLREDNPYILEFFAEKRAQREERIDFQLYRASEGRADAVSKVLDLLRDQDPYLWERLNDPTDELSGTFLLTQKPAVLEVLESLPRDPEVTAFINRMDHIKFFSQIVPTLENCTLAQLDQVLERLAEIKSLRTQQ